MSRLVSSDGKHLVAILSVMMPNFEEFLTRNSRIGIFGRPTRTSREEFRREVF
jgi:hypothetical protein